MIQNQVLTKTEKKRKELREDTKRKTTLIAMETALPTTPGAACQVPSPTEGILAPVLSSKYLIARAIFATESYDQWSFFL